MDIEYRNRPCLLLDLSAENKELRDIRISDPEEFSLYIDDQVRKSGACIALGRYGEDRMIYDHTELHAENASNRRTVHLGIDLWVPAGTAVKAPIDACIHSYADNKADGDYGPTIILQHTLDGTGFYTLYGHLSRESLAGIKPQMRMTAGQIIGKVGSTSENGHWPSHLHFQVISDMSVYKGDFPGVCTVEDAEKYGKICPDPDLILQIKALNQIEASR